MIKLLGKVPDDVYVACSGGPDSMAALSFLNNGKRNVSAVHFDHGTQHAHDAFSFVTKYCKENNIKLITGTVSRKRATNESREEFWRNERYRFFEELDAPVVTAHHLNDVEEWWVFSSLHGEPKIIPYRRNHVIRPFLLTNKLELMAWINNREVPYVTDPTNMNLGYMRNLIRHKIMPQCKKVNPGLSKVLRKKIISSHSQLNNFFPEQTLELL